MANTDADAIQTHHVKAVYLIDEDYLAFGLEHGLEHDGGKLVIKAAQTIETAATFVALQDILAELKLITAHLAIVTGEQLEEGDHDN